MTTPTQSRDDVGAIPTAARPATTKPPQPSTWSLKITMAITGAVFAFYVIVHLWGNLKIFISTEAVDHYAAWLRTLGNPLLPGETFLWIFRAVLVLCLVLHIYAGITIRMRGRKARGSFRRKGLKGFANFRTRYMLVTGILLLCFIIFHIMDLTLGTSPAASSEFQHEEAGKYFAGENLIASFQRPGVAIFYMIIMIMLFLHLAHGLVSMVYDLGGTGKRLRAVWLAIAGVISLLILLGNALIPFCVMIGVLK